MKDAEEKLLQVRGFSARTMRPLPYHNFLHAIDVRNACRRLSSLERISTYDEFLLETATYLHDMVYELGASDNEERSALLADHFLQTQAYTPEEIEQVQRLILATKIPTSPQNLLEKIICDADVDNLGREDFFEKCELLRKERGVEDKKIWYAQTLKFLENHHYYTLAAKKLRDEGLEKNKMDLRALVDVL